MPHEVACLTIHSVAATGQKVLAVGLWSDHSVVLLALPSLEVLSTTALNTPYLLRSILAVTFSDSSFFLFIGLGDGTLVSYQLDTSADESKVTLREETRKSVTLGTRPIVMGSFTTEQGPSLFVSSDRPTVVSRSRSRFDYAAVNARVSIAHTLRQTID